MKRVLVVAIVSMIFVAMSGCIGTYDASDKPPTSVGNIPGNQKDVVYDVVLILGDGGAPGAMEVEMYDDKTATIITTTVSGEVVEHGTWQLYRESPDHTLYDITTDDTELRLAFRNDAQAIGYIYHDGFTRWDESFYGTWEQIGEISDDEPTTSDESTSIVLDVIDSPSGDRSDEMPLTVYLDCYQVHNDPNMNPDMMEITLGQDGILVICADTMGDDCVQGEWTLNGDIYTTDVEYLPDMQVSLMDDGTAEVIMEGVPWGLEAEWSEGVS